MFLCVRVLFVDQAAQKQIYTAGDKAEGSYMALHASVAESH